MSAAEFAIVDSIAIVPRGSVVAVDAAIGATTLYVRSATDFRVKGGRANIGATIDDRALDGGTSIAYSSRVVDELAGDYLTLPTPLAAAVTAGTPVFVEKLVVEKIVYARLVRDPQGDPASCLVPAHLFYDSRLDETATGGGFVEVKRLGRGRWGVTDLPGDFPQLDLSNADATKPLAPGALTTSFQQQPDAFDESMPATALASGKVSAPIEFTNLQAGGFTANGDGFKFEAPDGGVPLSASAAGTRTGGGPADFTTLRATGPAQLGDVHIMAGHGITLDGLIAPPGVPPNGTEDYPAVDVALPTNMIAQQRHSLAIESPTSAYTTSTNKDGQVLLVAFNPTTGTFSSRRAFTGAPTGGAIVSMTYSSKADKIVTLEYVVSLAAWYVRYYSKSTGAFDHQWLATTLGSSALRRPAIGCFGFAGSEYLTLARANSDGTVAIYRYVDEAYSFTLTTADSFPFFDLEADSTQGDVLFLTGPTHMLDVTGDYPDEPVMPVIEVGGFFGTPGTTIGWLPIANGDRSGSIGAWDGDSFNETFYLSRLSNMLYLHGDPFRAGEQCVKVTGYQSSTTHETDASPAGFFTKRPGSRITFTIGAPPAGSLIDSYGFYMGPASGGVDPGDAAMWRQCYSTPGASTARIFDVKVAGPTLATARTPIASPTGAFIAGASGAVALDSSYSNPQTLPARVDSLEAGGGGGGSGVDDIIFISNGLPDGTGQLISVTGRRFA